MTPLSDKATSNAYYQALAYNDNQWSMFRARVITEPKFKTMWDYLRRHL